MENEITIPAGFKVAADSGNTVQQGIVIEDVNASSNTNVQGSQFVWIPVGEVTRDDGSTTTITFGRYAFDSTTGERTLRQNATGYQYDTFLPNSVPDEYGDHSYQELATYREGVSADAGENASAKDLKSFIEKTQSYGGFYFARYESSYGGNLQCASKISTSHYDGFRSVIGQLLNNVNQKKVSEYSINTYASSSSVKSD